MTNKKIATNICKILQNNGYEAVFAGGCVRDMLIGIEPHDYDVATSAHPCDIRSIFKDAEEVGANFGVMIINSIEVATFRNDGSYKDGRHPEDVKFSTMEEDAQRRDFTINGIFYDPISELFYDYVDGIDDLENNVLRFIGNAEDRIREDYLRILRGIRFMIKYNLELDKYTKAAFYNYGNLIGFLPKERIHDEFNKMLEIGRPYELIETLFKFNLMKEIIYEVTFLDGCEQNPKHHPEGDVLTHTCLAMGYLADCGYKDYRIQLAALLHDIGKPSTSIDLGDGEIISHGHAKTGAEIASNILTNLKYSNDDIDFVAWMVGNHMRMMDATRMKKSTIMKLAAEPYIEELLLLVEADIMASNKNLDSFSHFVEKMNEYGKVAEKPLDLPEPLVTGHDLIDLGFKPGPLFKEILEDVQNEQLEDKLLDKDSAIYYIKEHY